MNKSKKILTNDIDVSSKILNWSSYSTEEIGKWDVIIGADCLFFEDFHDDLLRLLEDILSSTGIALLFQPRRAGSMDRFIQKALQKNLFLEIKEDYSLKVIVLSKSMFCFINFIDLGLRGKRKV
jgi:predicted nicotinamide N-methyase